MRDLLLTHANIATLAADADAAYGLMTDANIAIESGRITWVGASDAVPSSYNNLPTRNLKGLSTRNLEGRLLTPSLIDCHTHIVHGGARAREFEQRLTGVSYADIAASGGGIVSTMTATRQSDLQALIDTALPRIDTLLAEGISVIEIKSGYGLDIETELNMLRAARHIGELRPVEVKTSFLGAHAVPGDYKDNPDAYIDDVCIPALHQAHAEGLVDSVDGFCESIAFTTAQIERVFKAARSLGLPVKLHAEQLTLSGGTELAARFAAQSVDHLEYLDETGVRAMAQSGSVAVLLPGAFYTLRETQLPPIDLFRQHGVPMAIATDSNPGSSPVTSLLLMLNMACTLFRLTPEEALTGATRHAAKALLINDRGTLDVGNIADIAVWDVEHPAELSYRIGFNPLFERINAAAPA